MPQFVHYFFSFCYIFVCVSVSRLFECAWQSCSLPFHPSPNLSHSPGGAVVKERSRLHKVRIILLAHCCTPTAYWSTWYILTYSANIY